jgi:formylglycine-generating enzyme required for sulfatase activity
MSRYEQPHEEWTDHTRHTPLTDEAIDDSQTTAPRYKSGAAVLLLLAAMALGAMVWSQHWKGMPTFSTTKPTSNPLLRSDNISPPTETKNPNAEATTALAPIIDGGGRGAVHLSLAQTSFYETPPFRYEFTRLGKVVTNGSFWKVEGDVVSLPAGDYHVTVVSKRLTWKLENAVQVVGGQTNQLPLTFAVGNLVVETEPSGATVKWSRTKNRLESDPNSAIAPFHNSFRSGAVVFRATRHGYEDTIATNFFYPMRTGSPTNFSIRLKPKPVPQLFETFSNSLGMTFHAIAQDTWISAFETRVRDFRQFVLETGSSDITNGMLSVTRDGLQPMGHSWEDPGPHFFQEDNHPVIGVNWDDALRFCIWLTQHEKDAGHLLPCQSYRLPTTNEWFAMTEPKQQYVISVDSVNFPRFPWGNTTNEIHGNYSGVEVTAGVWPPSWPVLSGYRDGFIRTAPVDDPAFPPISIGQDRFFYHVGGNAAEWCEGKVLCGGSWGDGEDGNLQFLETKNVYHPPEPLQRNDRNGFRVVIFDRDVQSPNEL